MKRLYGVFILDNIDGGCILAIHEDGSPVVFATENEAYEWGNDNYPSYFANHPNGWESYGLEIGRV